MENVPKKKTPWWGYPLIVLLFIVCSPIIIPCLIIFFPIYLVASPFERKRFRKSGYKEYHYYFFGITATVHYKLYKLLIEHNIPFEFTICKEYEIITYTLKKDNGYNLIVCDDKLGTSQSHFDSVETAFIFLERLGSLKYPQTARNYYICLERKDIKHMEISKQEKEELLLDARVIELKDVLALGEKENTKL